MEDGATAPVMSAPTPASSQTRPWTVPLSSLQPLYLSEPCYYKREGGNEDHAGTSNSREIVSSSSSLSHSRQASEIHTSLPISAPPIPPGVAGAQTSPSELQQERTRAFAQTHRRHPKAGPTPDRRGANRTPNSSISGLDHFTVAPEGSPGKSSAMITSDPTRLPAPLYVQHERMRTEPYAPVRVLSPHDRKRILVTGGAGFVGSHLVDRLMLMGHDVLVLDNFFTGQKSNLSHWIGHPNFELVRHDIVNPIMIEVDQIYHLACPASPPFYQANQIKTIKTNFMGTSNMLGLAKRTKARFLLASTSEVYGDPEVSPQKETYNGNVNQTGPRACYDEGKRVAETLAYGYLYQDKVDVRVARIFNSYGPRMNPFDGRVMSNFLLQALRGEPITVYGDGSQTRSFCFIHDLIDGLIALMNAEDDGDGLSLERDYGIHSPVNLGSENEFTIRNLVDEVAFVVEELRQQDNRQTIASSIGHLSSSPASSMCPTQAKVEIIYMPMPVDDPRQRRPDTTRAKELLDWEPRWTLRAGVTEMARFYLEQIKSGAL